MIIKRIFNNNVVLVEKEDRAEMVIMGKGIAFQKKTGDVLDERLIEKTFILKTKELSDKLSKLLSEIPTKYLELTDQIVTMAEEHLKCNLSENIYLTLTDHISYSITRTGEGMPIKNALLWEIQRFYKREFDAGLRALDIIESATGVKLPEDEAGFIALHFVNASQDGHDMQETIAMTKIVNDILNIVKYDFGIEFDSSTLSYTRFVTHLKYFVYRSFRNELVSSEDDFLFEQLKRKFPKVYQCTGKINDYLKKVHQFELSKEEMVYCMLHIRRVTSREENLNTTEE